MRRSHHARSGTHVVRRRRTVAGVRRDRRRRRVWARRRRSACGSSVGGGWSIGVTSGCGGSVVFAAARSYTSSVVYRCHCASSSRMSRPPRPMGMTTMGSPSVGSTARSEAATRGSFPQSSPSSSRIASSSSSVTSSPACQVVPPSRLPSTPTPSQAPTLGEVRVAELLVRTAPRARPVGRRIVRFAYSFVWVDRRSRQRQAPAVARPGEGAPGSHPRRGTPSCTPCLRRNWLQQSPVPRRAAAPCRSPSPPPAATATPVRSLTRRPTTKRPRWRAAPPGRSRPPGSWSARRSGSTRRWSPRHR